MQTLRGLIAEARALSEASGGEGLPRNPFWDVDALMQRVDRRVEITPITPGRKSYSLDVGRGFPYWLTVRIFGKDQWEVTGGVPNEDEVEGEVVQKGAGHNDLVKFLRKDSLLAFLRRVDAERAKLYAK